MLPRRWFFALLPLFVVLGTLASAQQERPIGKPKPFVCMPGQPGCHTYPPSVSISPANGSFFSKSLAITVIACDSISAVAATVTLNGTNITSQLTETTLSGTGQCAKEEKYTGTITLAVGSNTLTATAQNDFSGNLTTATATATYTYTVPTYTVTVTPSIASENVSPGQNGSMSFTVKNTGNVPNTFTFTTSCSGVVIASCGNPSPASQMLNSNATVSVSLPFTISSAQGSTGSVGISAGGSGGANGTGSTTVTTLPGAGLDVVNANPGPSFDRKNCLTVSVGERAAFECGDLRITHPLGSIRTYGKVRTPTLIYNWRFATPAPNLGALLTIPASSISLDSVNGTLYIWPHNQPSLTQVAMTGWWSGAEWNHATAQVTRRIQLTWGGYGAASGYYDFAFATRRHYGSVVAQDSSVGHFVFVNRYASPFGAGWWLVGYESIQFYSDGISWIGGDGSTQWYIRPGNTGSVWYPQTYVAERDSIIQNGSQYVRYAAHGAQVVFNSLGRHVQTIDRLGHTTTFGILNGTTRLETLTVPQPGGQAGYRFDYMGDAGVADTTLIQVTAPGGLINFTDTLRATGATKSFTSIADIDGYRTSFTFDPEGGGQTRISSRIDKLGTQTIFEFGNGAETLGYAQIVMQQGAGHDIIHTFQMPNGFGQAAPWITEAQTHSANPDSILVQINGPRFNAGEGIYDVTVVWIDKWWQPDSIRDPKGNMTRLTRGNATYPALVTRAQYADGRVLGATYDARGNIATATDSSMQIGGAYATTAYQFDGRWDFDTLTTLPLGETIHDSLDAQGNVAWHQLGTSTVYRTTFDYSDPCGLVQHVTEPVSTQPWTYLYEGGACNLSYRISPNGYYTSYVDDGLGRVTSILTAIDSNDHANHPVNPLVESHYYDAMDRDTLTTTTGPAEAALPGSIAQTISIARKYDLEGNLIAVNRTVSPDSNNIATLHTATVYDRAHRPIADTAVNGAVTTRKFDAASNLDTLITPRGYTIVSQYDSLNRLVNKIVPSYTADTIKSGIPTDPFQGTGLGGPAHSDTSYGANGYTPYITRPYGGQVVHGDTITFQYDPLGRILEADNVNAKITRQYYPNGALMSETQRVRTLPDSGALGSFTKHVYTVGYHYDRDGRRDSLYFPAQLKTASQNGPIGTTQSYAYNDTTGWLSSITDPAGATVTFGFDGRGDLGIIRYLPWQYQDVRGYDNDGNQNYSMIDKWVAPDTLWRLSTFAYDGRDKLVYSANKVGLSDTVRVDYTGLGYAAQDASVDYNNGIRSLTSEHFQYDALGNKMRDTTFSNDIMQDGSSHGYTGKTWAYQPSTSWLTAAYDGANNDSLRYRYDLSGNTTFEFTSKFSQITTPTPAIHDRASSYNAQEQLVEADYRAVANPGANIFSLTRADELSRYDALGRRVLVHASRTCGPYQVVGSGYRPDDCRRSFVRRTAYDGQQELVEFQARDSIPLTAEMDSGVVRDSVDRTGGEATVDNNPFFGQVMYVHALGVDEPVDVIRLNWANRTDLVGNSLPYYVFPPAVELPFWNYHGRNDFNLVGLVVNGALTTNPCQTVQGTRRCPKPPFEVGFAAYNNVPTGAATTWYGSLLEDKFDQTMTQYRRARSYDPVSGRFTQPDPMGLAGGVNDYGFANGDPANFSDPFGLAACTNDGGIHIAYEGYEVHTPVGQFPLGHAAVIAVDERTGNTRYYEYGRYDKAGKGIVRREPVPNVVIGKDGKPTKASLEKLYSYVSEHYGEGKKVKPEYHAGADYQKIVNFAEGRMHDPNRKPYGIIGNNCKTFARQAIEAGEAH